MEYIETTNESVERSRMNVDHYLCWLRRVNDSADHGRSRALIDSSECSPRRKSAQALVAQMIRSAGL